MAIFGIGRTNALRKQLDEAQQKNSHTARFRLGCFRVLELCLEPIDRGSLEA